ncbi:hypothetical protein B0H13DRAFT_1908320 [Mycena leptocephala]|nr:hypothetical protein B0H13DRAFT_1908320 [Mycena leptocephala]
MSIGREVAEIEEEGGMRRVDAGAVVVCTARGDATSVPALISPKARMRARSGEGKGELVQGRRKNGRGGMTFGALGREAYLPTYDTSPIRRVNEPEAVEVEGEWMYPLTTSLPRQICPKAGLAATTAHVGVHRRAERRECRRGGEGGGESGERGLQRGGSPLPWQFDCLVALTGALLAIGFMRAFGNWNRRHQMAAAEAAELASTDRMLFSTIITSSGGARGEISVSTGTGKSAAGRGMFAFMGGQAFTWHATGAISYKTSGGMARSHSALISRQVFVWRAWWRARRRLLHAEATAKLVATGKWRTSAGREQHIRQTTLAFRMAGARAVADAFASRRGGRKTRGGTAASLCRGWHCIEGSFGAAVGRAGNRQRENAAVGRDGEEVVEG